MNSDETILAGENKSEVRNAMYILIVWTLVVIIAGLALIFFRDSFSGLFTLLGLF
ncbi:hypothetical protein ACLI4R_07400 [Natrialbaceae archaeon A-chndr2]|uniref:Uncharacterized protein n=1 Tax=Natronosalvus hydrolyticus TaxID=2979988 RepID=A0AAP2Z822_9EURY|nr:hypothetical protein [Halobacteria archaeon AArc-curdl1]